MSRRPSKRPRTSFNNAPDAKIKVLICGAKASWMPVQIISKPSVLSEQIVFEFGIWGPMHAAIFQHVFEFRSLDGMRVDTAVRVLRRALEELEALGVPLPKSPPEDKTKRSFQVFGWYLQMLLGVSETHQHRDTPTHPLFWRIGPPEPPTAQGPAA